MATQKGFSIFFASEDMPELLEFCKWKAAKHQSKFASIDTDFDLAEANDLIRQHRLEDAARRERLAQQEAQIAVVGEQRERVSTLPDWQAKQELDRQQQEWAKEAEAQGKEFASERNAGRGGRAYLTDEEKTARDGVISWLRAKRHGRAIQKS